MLCRSDEEIETKNCSNICGMISGLFALADHCPIILPCDVCVCTVQSTNSIESFGQRRCAVADDEMVRRRIARGAAFLI